MAAISSERRQGNRLITSAVADHDRPQNTALSGKAGLQRLPAKRAHHPALSVPTHCWTSGCLVRGLA